MVLSHPSIRQDAVVKPFISVNSCCGNDIWLLPGLHLPFHKLLKQTLYVSSIPYFKSNFKLLPFPLHPSPLITLASYTEPFHWNLVTILIVHHAFWLQSEILYGIREIMEKTIHTDTGTVMEMSMTTRIWSISLVLSAISAYTATMKTPTLVSQSTLTLNCPWRCYWKVTDTRPSSKAGAVSKS